MRHLVYLLHADPSVAKLYEGACQRAGLDVDVVCVVCGNGSAAYRQLWYDCHGLDGLKARYRPPRHGYDTIVGASWSAGYGFWRELLNRPEGLDLDGLVLIDSWYGALEHDGTAADSQLGGMVSMARRATEGPHVLWMGHTDVKTPQTGANRFASTGQVADEMLRLAGVNRGPDGVAESGGLRVWPVDKHASDHDEHVAALREWGPGMLAEALTALEARLPAFAAPPPTKDQSIYPLGERALTVARGEQERGVKEIPGNRHDSRILAYLAGCMRGGKRIGGCLQADEVAWCAAFASWCARMACGGAEPHQWRAAVRELWLDALGSGAAIAADRLRSGAERFYVGDLVIMTRGAGVPGRYDEHAFAATEGKGHVGRILCTAPLITIDGNVRNTITDVERELSQPSLVGTIRYPRPEPVPAVVPGDAELTEAARLWKLHDNLRDGTDTALAEEMWDA